MKAAHHNRAFFRTATQVWKAPTPIPVTGIPGNRKQRRAQQRVQRKSTNKINPKGLDE
jgi:hypothetical protein